jgi:2-polyprenyl-3-methyl-5-hydroxy-6-metoxy-1,4-benzoquinol methylase
MRLINRDYIASYNNAFKEILDKSPENFYDDSALPSYTHGSRLMSWLFWKRIDETFIMAGSLDRKSVLDFGCGGGVTFKYLNKHNCKITGCDNQSDELAYEICKQFGIKADIFEDLFEIQHREFDYIFALDVLEHIEEIDPVIDKLLLLSHERTRIIISGPTENLPYRAGRWLAGFSGHYHVKNIYEVEKKFRERKIRNTALKKLYPPCTLFRISSWSR